MHVRCPHCRNPIELVAEGPLSEIDCPSCGSSFSLVGTDTTTTYRPETNETIGHFELLDRLGMGAFGTVWKAHDTELDRTVAVKIPRHGQLNAEDSEKFLREARAAAQLKHPGIVSVYEVGREDDTVYIVSDCVDGLTLTDWLSGQQPTPREAAELCVKIAEALQHAHEKGVIHRDLKPANIMMDTDGDPHIVDFGLAKLEAGEITMTVEGQILGTPVYMPPEQARGEGHRVDRRADVYSLGVILFELLTGELPFRGDKQMLIVQILIDDPPPLRKLNNVVSRDLETICLKCLEKAVYRRYDGASDLADELLRWLTGQPIVARRSSLLERSHKWVRRKPTVAALLGVTVAATLLIIVGLVVSNLVIGGALDVRTAALNKLSIEEEKTRRALADRTIALADLTNAHEELGQKERETHLALERERKALAATKRRTYQRSVLLARREWQSNNLTRANQILDECPIELRGFEWRYLKRQCNHPGLLSIKEFGTELRRGAQSRRFGSHGERIVRVQQVDPESQTSYQLTIVDRIDAGVSHVTSMITGFEPQIVVISPNGQRVAAANLCDYCQKMGRAK